MDSEKHCRLCAALHNPFSGGEILPQDIVLCKTPHFVVLPAAGPLVAGHVLIVSRHHCPSLATMSKEALGDYQRLVELLAGSPSVAGNLLEAEHGATRDLPAGGCITHTHVNVFPGLGNHSNLFTGILPVLGTFNDPAELNGLGEPYLLLRGNLGQLTLFKADTVPSQAIRRALCRRLQQPNWDWRTEPRTALVTETLAFWKSALAHE